MGIFETITFSIAVLGAVLGIINTSISLSKERVKLLVTPKKAIPFGNTPNHLEFCIEVVNLSSFPVTVSEIGVFYHRSKMRSVIANPITLDGGPYPRRLEPRSSVVFYSEAPEPRVNDQKMRAAFAKTDCGILKTGVSPVFKEMTNAI